MSFNLDWTAERLALVLIIGNEPFLGHFSEQPYVHLQQQTGESDSRPWVCTYTSAKKCTNYRV